MNDLNFDEQICILVIPEWEDIISSANKKNYNVVDLWDGNVHVFTDEINVILGAERLAQSSCCFDKTIFETINSVIFNTGRYILITDLITTTMTDDFVDMLHPMEVTIYKNSGDFSIYNTSKNDVMFNITSVTMEHIYRELVSKPGRICLPSNKISYDKDAILWCKNICVCTSRKLEQYYTHGCMCHIIYHTVCTSCQEYISSLPVPCDGIIYDVSEEVNEIITVIRKSHADTIYILNTLIGVNDPTKGHKHAPTWWYLFIEYMILSGYLERNSRGQSEFLSVNESNIRNRHGKFTICVPPYIIPYF